MIKLVKFILILINSAAFGQHYFNFAFDFNDLMGVEGYAGIAYDGENFWIQGTPIYNSNPYLIKFDFAGNLLLEIKVESSGDGNSFRTGNNNPLLIDEEKNLIFVGQMHHDFDDEYDPNAIIFKVNTFGDTIWTKEFINPSEYSGLASVKATIDGNYILSGFTTEFGSFAQAWLVKMDTDGNILWQQNYGGFGGENAYSVDTTIDGGYILAGFTDTYGAGERDIYVIKTDQFGNKQWEKWFGTPGNDGAFVKSLDNGTFIVYGARNFIHPIYDYLDAVHGYVMNLDENGEIIWAKDYANYDTTSILYYANFENILDCQIVNDGLVFCGSSTDSIINNPIGWVFKTDFQGNVLWDRKYQLRTNDHYLWDMTELPGGDLLFGGFVFPTGGGVDSQDGWIMRTNCLGFNGPPILDASVELAPETHTATVYNASQRFGDGSIDWGDGTSTLFTEHDTTVFTHAYTQNGNFDITFKINACYHHDSLIFHQTISGIPDPEPPITDFKLFPNPTSGSLTISYNPTGESLDAGIQIFDIAGRLVYNIDLPLFYVNTTLDISQLSTGTYLLRFFTVEGDEVVEKLVVK